MRATLCLLQPQPRQQANPNSDQARTDLRCRIVSAFVGRCQLERCDAKENWPANTAASR